MFDYFGLDAAMANIPVLQLNVSHKDFGSFAKSKDNPHIEKYLLRSNLISFLAKMIIIDEMLIHKGRKYSKMLKNCYLNNSGT